MLSWLFGGTSECKLILEPDTSARSLPGFRSGEPLQLIGNKGDTVGMILDRFNTYRAPDSQIKNVWKSDGTPLGLSTPVNGIVVATVKASSAV